MRDLCARDLEPAENNLKDLLQQLNSILAAKPAERPLVRQGEAPVAPAIARPAQPVSTGRRFFGCRGGRGPRVHSHLLDQQVGGLLGQVRVR